MRTAARRSGFGALALTVLLVTGAMRASHALDGLILVGSLVIVYPGVVVSHG